MVEWFPVEYYLHLIMAFLLENLITNIIISYLGP
jgi:hypothetical protein